MFEVVASFENQNVAVKAAELLSVAFPMLTFEFRIIPEIDFNNFDLPDFSNTCLGVSNDK